MGLEIRAASREEIAELYVNFAQHWTAAVDGRPVAIGSLSKTGERWWACFTIVGDVGRSGAAVVRGVRRRFGEHNQDIYAVCQSPAAERFLSLVGCVPTEETVNARRVWVWKPRQSAIGNRQSEKANPSFFPTADCRLPIAGSFQRN
jgi:hypothetical protein